MAHGRRRVAWGLGVPAVVAVLVAGVGAVGTAALIGTGPAAAPGAATRPPAYASAATPAGPGAVLSVAPDGSGTACTVTEPCALTTAVAAAPEGGVVELAEGDYPDQKLPDDSPAAHGYATNVVLRPASGAAVSLSRLSIHQPHLTVSGITVTGVLYVNPAARHTRIERVHVDGGGVFVRADDVAVVDSLIEGGSDMDGVQIGGSRGVLVEGTTIRDFDQDGDSGHHADCIQLYDSSDVVIRGNRLSNCYNSAIIFSGGQDTGIDRVLIEANFLQGCLVKGPSCNGGNILDLRYEKARDVTLVNNTLDAGTVRLGELPGLVADRNFVNYLSQCESPLTNSIVQKWNVGLCEEPDAVGRDGTRVGALPFVDRDAGDLHVTDPQAATVRPARAAEPPATTGTRLEPTGLDIDGEPFRPGTVGADEPGPR